MRTKKSTLKPQTPLPIKLCMTIVLAAMFVSACKTEKWQFTASKYDLRTASIAGQGKSNGIEAKTMLSIECGPGRNGAVSINYTVYNTDKAGGFDFDSFEGPYAPASSKKLATIEIAMPNETIEYETSVSGYYIENKSFVFSANAMNRGASGVRTIVEMLTKGAKSISITIHDINDTTNQIKTEFPAKDAQPIIEKTIVGCLKD